MHQVKWTIFLFISLFFMAFGIDLMISAYRLSNPFSFVMVFFAASLIILISATLTLGFAIRIIRNHRADGDDKNHPPDPGAD